MIEVQAADLIGPALDWAVAKAVGECSPQRGGGVCVVAHGHTLHRFCPSTEWSHGGPLIEKENLTVERSPSMRGCAVVGFHNWRAVHPKNYGGLIRHTGYGETALIAACRAVVSAKIGDTVQVPKELMP